MRCLGRDSAVPALIAELSNGDRSLTRGRGNAPGRRSAQRLEELTEGEHDVLRLLSRGASNTEIGAALHVSEATVRTHVDNIFTKLGVRDRAAAMVYAFDHGAV